MYGKREVKHCTDKYISFQYSKTKNRWGKKSNDLSRELACSMLRFHAQCAPLVPFADIVLFIVQMLRIATNLFFITATLYIIPSISKMCRCACTHQLKLQQNIKWISFVDVNDSMMSCAMSHFRCWIYVRRDFNCFACFQNCDSWLNFQRERVHLNKHLLVLILMLP